MRIAIISPSFAAPGAFTELHEQALRRMRGLGWEPVEYPTTREVGASPADRARDVTAALSDPSIDAVLASIGGTDQILVITQMTASQWEQIADRRPLFFGYSDNTHLHNELFRRGIPSVYGGSTQVHLAPGSGIDPLHLASLQAALAGSDYQMQRPGWYADFGVNWETPEALTQDPAHLLAPDWQFRGGQDAVTAATWGGCLEVIADIAVAGRLPAHIDGHILLLEASEECTEPWRHRRLLRALGERGYLSHVAGVVVALPPGANLEGKTVDVEEFNEAVESALHAACPEVPRVYGVPFGHTLPQQVVPYGGAMSIDPRAGSITCHFGTVHTRAR
ncbi:LD-carboxypeptidase [Corynebacterium sp. 13CS0277]|uniref:LD-carboxypeptidase n=1 Tax=Corynebacterium sp. 13CS0277 TaxID=2071994 RepID=UPI000D036463|nr:LD-carboxypeptidase [Corynebacterium sp. 13CS0277]PRQ10920.1 LD-carboxypeptidase [Corynebacterium sp. 13CS0277]